MNQNTGSVTDIHSKVDDEAATVVAKTLGWSFPPKSVIDMARASIVAKKLNNIGELMVHMRYVTRAQLDKALERKPEIVSVVAWMAQQEPGAGILVEKVIALVSGVAYYDSMNILTVHPSMREKDVLARADEIDAAVMMIEESKPVVVFATVNGLLKFRAQGREDRANDAIAKVIGTEHHFAVGPRDEISAIIKDIKSLDVTLSEGEAANVWNAESSEHRGKAEYKEIIRLIDYALSVGANDIALFPSTTGELTVQIRKAGQMMAPKAVAERMNSELSSQVLNLLMARSGANPTNTVQRVPTDGQITYRSSVGEAFLRLSFIPLNHLGSVKNLTSVSIRLMPRTEAAVDLDKLGLDVEVVDQIRFAMQMSQGLVLVVGPTNSGKSTTIAGAIGEHVKIFGFAQKRLSVEDPIERLVAGVTQINVPPINLIKDENERFSTILKAMKRHDPDMIWVGEVRDRVTAELCVSSATTGHLVLSTLHANDAVMGFDVLAKSVAEDRRFQMIEAVSMIISQRLLRVLCPHCRTIHPTTIEDRKVFKKYLDSIGDVHDLPETIGHAKVGGCSACNEEGYLGLVPINEVLPFTRAVKNAASQMISGENTRDVMAGGRTKTMLQSSLEMLRAHRVSLNDILI